jgi:hypothetical protein
MAGRFKMTTVKWNYTDRAEHYDKRADYSKQAVGTLRQKMAQFL